MKRCGRCKKNKDLRFFSESKRTRDGYRCWCKYCCNKMNRQYYNPSKEGHRKRDQRYGLYYKDYNTLFDKQEGKCALCGISHSEVWRGLHVDHCHKTNIVRGLLCFHCNTALGKLGDSEEQIQKVLKYLTNKTEFIHTRRMKDES